MIFLFFSTIFYLTLCTHTCLALVISPCAMFMIQKLVQYFNWWYESWYNEIVFHKFSMHSAFGCEIEYTVHLHMPRVHFCTCTTYVPRYIIRKRKRKNTLRYAFDVSEQRNSIISSCPFLLSLWLSKWFSTVLYICRSSNVSIDQFWNSVGGWMSITINADNIG